MTEAYKVCPICEAHSHRNAAICGTCGASIAEVPPRETSVQQVASEERYDYRLGEADLAEGALAVRGRVLSGVLIVGVLLLAGVLAATAILSALADQPGGVRLAAMTAMPTRKAGPTVTAGEPTATFTASAAPSITPTESPTPAPCVQKVAAGDSLIGIVARCGHRSLAVLPTVMAINGIVDETRLQIGQEIVIPFPSLTAAPAATEPAASTADVDSADAGTDDLLRLAFDPLAPTLTPTLLPGLMWHIVQPEENIIIIALRYDTDAKTLSDVNPEIDFPLCDFSVPFGGPECTVVLFLGQQVRVPAPPATVTPIPTSSGSETPTPMPSATFNAPIAQSPLDQAFFARQEQVTLRWVGTGQLESDEVYRVTLVDTEIGVSYAADTRELFFIIPTDWQATDTGSHQFTWQVSVVDVSSGVTDYASEIRSFVWQGRGTVDS